MEQNEKFMREAIRLSIENVEKGLGGPFGAIVVKDGKVIATGVNQVTENNDPTAHAEVTAIRNACAILETFQLSECDLYTSCEPCPMCLGAIYWARPKRVFYANTKKDAADIDFDDDFIYKEIEMNYEERSIPFIQLLPEEAIEAFNKWKESDTKQEY